METNVMLVNKNNLVHRVFPLYWNWESGEKVEPKSDCGWFKKNRIVLHLIKKKKKNWN